MIDNVAQMSGFSERSYSAMLLNGKFYDPGGSGRAPTVRPHLEISSRVLEHADKEFPYRLALIGNGLAFTWWMMTEVKATRRALFNTTGGSIEEVAKRLGGSRDPLIEALGSLVAVASAQWDVIEGLLVTSGDGLLMDATGDFSAEEVARYFPGGADLHLKVSFDGALSQENGRWASRRSGVWQISGVSGGENFSFGVLTPRLTAKSLFREPLFYPAGESPAALLVRGLVLDRLVRVHLNDELLVAVGKAKAEINTTGGPRLRIIVAQENQRLPEASLESAVHFIQHFSDASDAWSAITALADKQGTVLIPFEEGFLEAYRNAQRFLRRAEDPLRSDLNVIMPLGWNKGRVVRFTFSRPSSEDDAG
jgi:hypothetical protein